MSAIGFNPELQKMIDDTIDARKCKYTEAERFRLALLAELDSYAYQYETNGAASMSATIHVQKAYQAWKEAQKERA